MSMGSSIRWLSILVTRVKWVQFLTKKLSPIGRSFQKMCERGRDNLRLKFNSVYYLLKQERPFSDYPHLLKLQTKNRVKPIGSSYLHEQAAATFVEVTGDVHHRSLKEKLAKARYYYVLNDGSSDTSVSEKELVYVLFLDDGKPKIEILSIEDVKNADAAGIQECITESFQRIGITKFSEKMVGLNVDVASVNMGKFTGLGTRLKVEAPWLQVIHCFNQRLELALRDAFSQSPVFSTVDTFITKLYYLYQKSP